MVSRQFDPVAALTELFPLLGRNWMLAVPYAVCLVITIAIFLVLGGGTLLALLMSGPGAMMGDPTAISATVASAGLALGAGALVGMILMLIAGGATYAGADDVLSGRPIDLSAVTARGLAVFGQLFLYGFVLFLAFCVAWLVVVLLGIISHGILGILGGLVLFVAAIYVGFLFVYAAPSIVVDRKNAFDAMGESTRLARANVSTTIVLILGLIVVGILNGILGAILHPILVVGSIISLAIGALAYAFSALACLRFYFALSRGMAGGQIAAAAPAQPPMVPPPSPSPPMMPPPPSQ